MVGNKSTASPNGEPFKAQGQRQHQQQNQQKQQHHEQQKMAGGSVTGKNSRKIVRNDLEKPAKDSTKVNNAKPAANNNNTTTDNIQMSNKHNSNGNNSQQPLVKDHNGPKKTDKGDGPKSSDRTGHRKNHFGKIKPEKNNTPQNSQQQNQQHQQQKNSQQKQHNQQIASSINSNSTIPTIIATNGGIMIAQSCAKCQHSYTPIKGRSFRNKRTNVNRSKRSPSNNANGNGNSNGNGQSKTSNDAIESRNSNRALPDQMTIGPNYAIKIPEQVVPITPLTVMPIKRQLSSSVISEIFANSSALTILEKSGTGRHCFPLMQCGTLEVPDSYQRSPRTMDAFQIDDGFHSDGGTETPPPSPSSGSSIASTSDHGSLENVDTGGAQRLAVLSFEQVRKLNDVMDETVSIHGRGNFPTLEVKLKDLVTLVRKKLEADVASGGAGMIVKDIRLNGGAASHVLASEAQPYNDLDLIFAIEFSSNRHFDRVKSAVLSTLLDLLPEGVSRRRILPCSLKEAYVGKMVKVNNNNDGDRWSLISLGNSPGHKNVELKFVDTMRRQFEFSVDSFQIVLDSLLLFYDCAALPISENFYPTVVGESVYGDFQEALYHLQKKLISTRQPEEIRGGGLLKYCNLLVRNYQPVDPEKIKILERYMCSRFFIDFPDINTQTVKLEGYLRNHFWGADEEPLQYQYLMHLREVVETSTVCLMGHERRQTLLLIQSLAMQVLCREQQKQQHQQAQQQQQQQQQHHQHQSTQQSVQSQQTQSQQCMQSQQTQPTATQTIQLQPPPGLLYANGVYYAPVIPTTICTCNSTWLST